MWKYLLISALALSAGFAADRSELSGTWVLDAGHSQINGEKPKSETLIIDQKADSISVSESVVASAGTEKKTDIACNTLGKQCNLKEDGRKLQVSAWYNGPALVLMEVRGNADTGDASKTRFTTSEDGKTLKLEVTHITPPGASDSYTFLKQDTVQSSSTASPGR